MVSRCFNVRRCASERCNWSNLRYVLSGERARLSGLYCNLKQAYSMLETAKVSTEGGTDVAMFAFTTTAQFGR